MSPSARLAFITLTYAVTVAAGSARLANAASISLCPADTELGPDIRSEFFYSQTGDLQILAMSDDEIENAQCLSIRLPQSLGSISWASIVTPDAARNLGNRIILQGSFLPNSVSVSEIIASEPAVPQPLQPASQPQPSYDAVVFGLEERAVWSEDERLLCSAGNNVAGVQLRSRVGFPDDEQLQLLWSGSGRFQILLADEEGIRNESSQSLGELNSEDSESTNLSRMNMPQNPDPWIALTLLCPASGGELELLSIDFLPAFEESDVTRSAWVWQPSLWREDPEFFWRLSQLENIQEFYITVPVNIIGEVSNARQLRDFVREASNRDLRVWAVIGDRNDVLEENHDLLRNRISAYKRFNSRSLEEERLAGVQLDIEPYLLPGHNLAIDIWRERYLETIAAAIQIAGDSLPVDLVMPVWWGDHPDWGPSFLDRLDAPNLSITAMNYRTDIQQLLRGAIPFLNWGNEKQRAVRMALETGTLSDETRRIYMSENNRGELWSLNLGESPLLVLFNSSQEGLDGTPYRLDSVREFSANNLSFSGNQRLLNATASQLSEKWQQWPSFVGIALHGLDEVYREQ